MQTSPIVITSIFPPTKAVKKFVSLVFKVIVVGDLKTTPEWNYKNCEFLSVNNQLTRFPKISSKISKNHYARKNIGYLLAMEDSGSILETDDDNIPYNFYPNFVTNPFQTDCFSSSSSFFNTYSYLAKNQNVWPRGFPIDLIIQKNKIIRKKIKSKFPLQQSLADLDADFDAIYRLTVNKNVKFETNKTFALEKGTYSPINSQNTYWTKEAFLFMYLPSLVSSRVCDIYRGYIAQRLLWETGNRILFLSSSVYQERNPHNYLKDFEQEIPVYLNIRKLINILESESLKGSIEEKMLQLYKALAKNSLVPKEEIEILKIWINEVGKIS